MLCQNTILFKKCSAYILQIKKKEKRTEENSRVKGTLQSDWGNSYNPKTLKLGTLIVVR